MIICFGKPSVHHFHFNHNDSFFLFYFSSRNSWQLVECNSSSSYQFLLSSWQNEEITNSPFVASVIAWFFSRVHSSTAHTHTHTHTEKKEKCEIKIIFYWQKGKNCVEIELYIQPLPLPVDCNFSLKSDNFCILKFNWKFSLLSSMG